MIPSEKPLATAPVFRFSEWGTQFWVWIQHVLDFLRGFFIHLFPFRLSLVCLHYREIIISLPLGFEAQLVPIVLDIWLLLQGFVHLGKETVLGPHLTQHGRQMVGFYQRVITPGNVVLGFMSGPLSQPGSPMSHSKISLHNTRPRTMWSLALT